METQACMTHKHLRIEFVPEIDESIPKGLVLQSNLAYTDACRSPADTLKRTVYKRMNKLRIFGTFAARNLKGNVMLSILMVTAIGVLISASMTTLMLLSAMAHSAAAPGAMAPDPQPLPQQSAQLVSVQKENWATPKNEWSVETNRICDRKSAGLIRLLL